MLHVPEDYYPSDFFMSKNIDDLFVSNELKQKMKQTLDRMPNTDGPVCISFSGGKDSQVIFLLARMKYRQHQLFAMFSDTHDEWPQTYQAISDFEQWIDVPIHTLNSIGIHELLRHHKSCWPMMGRRFCTKDLKMLPQRDFLDQQGYAQLRIRGGHKYRSGEDYAPMYKAPLMLVGERWLEGGDRKNLPFDERESFMLRQVHRPILDWTIENVWDFIFSMQAPINSIYTLGIKRAACAGCIFAKPEEIMMLYDHQPQLFHAWKETETYINHPRPGFTFDEIERYQIVKKNNPHLTFLQFKKWGTNQLSLSI